jgi:hypothetical protein
MVHRQSYYDPLRCQGGPDRRREGGHRHERATPVGRPPLFYFVTNDRNQDGVVLASLGDGFFLCRVNAWADGPAAQRVFHLDDFAARHEDGFPHFEFFDSMQDADAYRVEILKPDKPATIHSIKPPPK